MKQELTAVRLLAFATGIIAGTFAALAAQIYLAHLNIELATAWRDLFVTWHAQTRSAFAWWTMALVALVIGYIVAAMTRFMMLHWWPLRVLRWIAGIAIVAALAVIGHDGRCGGKRGCRSASRGEPARRDVRDEHRFDRRRIQHAELKAAHRTRLEP
jgi:hypothetical protein